MNDFYIVFHRKKEGTMKKKIAAILLGLGLMAAPVWTLAQDVKEFQGRVKSKTATEVVAESREDGEKTFAISERTTGVENASEGARVIIKYSERDGQLRAREITPR
jgi:hypothetical protein